VFANGGSQSHLFSIGMFAADTESRKSQLQPMVR
jgi:hypothetical protein